MAARRDTASDQARRTAHGRSWHFVRWLHLLGRTAKMPICRVLIGPADPQRGCLFVGAADDLDGDRKPVACKAIRQRERAEVKEISKPGVVGRRTHLIHLVERERGLIVVDVKSASMPPSAAAKL